MSCPVGVLSEALITALPAHSHGSDNNPLVCLVVLK